VCMGQMYVFIYTCLGVGVGVNVWVHLSVSDSQCLCVCTCTWDICIHGCVCLFVCIHVRNRVREQRGTTSPTAQRLGC
jgi:hypothetical protein